MKLSLKVFSFAALLFAAVAHGAESKLDKLTASYPSVTGNMAPLWAAQDLRLFEKNGLDVTLVNIASGVI
jgi:ABC-type nitrate/sulfonate/bicarbonate transport system substrate-binding protein